MLKYGKEKSEKEKKKNAGQERRQLVGHEMKSVRGGKYFEKPRYCQRRAGQEKDIVKSFHRS